MYDALTISKYIVNYSESKLSTVSNLKLQKLLYFIQCEFIIEKNKPCFKEDIEAWGYGPVIPAIYNEYKKFGASYIPTYYTEDDTDDGNILPDDKKLINSVIDCFLNYSANDLLNIIQKQSPWKNAYTNNMSNKITNESIRNYFID